MNLVPRFTLGALDLTEYPFAIEFGSDLGNPTNAAELVETLMQDGEIIASSRSSNREIKIPLLIEGSDLDALAEAESSLLLECDKIRNTLTVDPGDGYAVETQFDTFRAQVVFQRNDEEEVAGFRRYLLTIPALPFGGSVDEITTVGVTSAATPTTVVVNDGSSTTNWTQISYDSDSTAGPADLGAGYVIGSLNPYSEGDGYYESQGSLIYTPASPIDMSSTQYLQVDARLSFYGSGSSFRAFADGIELPLMSAVAIPGSAGGFTRYTYLCSDASVASVRIKGPRTLRSVDGSSDPRSGSIQVDQLIRTNQAPSSSTLRQKVTAVAVSGSARTQGSLRVEHETSALGYTIVHTYPDLGDGYTPDLRRWLTSSSTVTTDATLVSGAFQPWGSSTYSVPLRILRPGPYLLAGRFRLTSGTPGNVKMSTGGVSGLVNFAATNAWQVSAIGVLEVGDHIAGTAFSQVLSCTASGSVDVDALWMFYVGDDASLTRINLGTGTPSASGSSNRLWLDTPNPSRPYPSIWRGTLADKSDARNAVSDADAWEDVRAQPPSMTVFTVTTNALDAKVSLTHRPRWHTHARKLS